MFIRRQIVHTADGQKSIEDIKAGDLVWSMDEKKKEIALRKVVRILVTPNQPVIELCYYGKNGIKETLGVTAEHPFWMKDRGWVSADKLLPGDKIFALDGKVATVSGSTLLNDRKKVYNFEVEEFHNYFAGETGVLVHNSCN